MITVGDVFTVDMHKPGAGNAVLVRIEEIDYSHDYKTVVYSYQKVDGTWSDKINHSLSVIDEWLDRGLIYREPRVKQTCTKRRLAHD